jgi:hypothetical protein
MSMILANAPIPPSTDSNVELVLSSAGVVLVIAVLGLVPIFIARLRRHRQLEAITAIIVLWGVLLAGSICYSIMQQMDWTKALQERIESGYYDPQDTTGKPTTPVPLWCGLGVCYAAITFWATRAG